MSISEIKGQGISFEASTQFQGQPSSEASNMDMLYKDTIQPAEGAKASSCDGGGGGDTSSGGMLDEIKKLLEKLIEMMSNAMGSGGGSAS